MNRFRTRTRKHRPLATDPLLVAAITFLSVATFSSGQSTAPVHEAAKSGDTTRLATILKTTAEATELKDPSGNTPLHIAAWDGHDDAVKLLLKHGADPNVPGMQEWTPLHFAARGGHPETCRILLRHGADRTRSNGANRNPLQTATDPDTARVLRDFQPVTPGADELVAAAAGGALDDVKKRLADAPQLLDARATNGSTATITAAEKGHTETLRWLLERGADPNRTKIDGWNSPLVAACGAGHLQIVDLLIAKGANPDPPLPTNRSLLATKTPLSAAASTTVPGPTMEPLMTALHGIFQTHGSKHPSKFRAAIGRFFAELSRGQGREEFFRQLAIPEPDATRAAKRQIVQRLLGAGARPDALALQMAAGSSEPGIVGRLLDASEKPFSPETLDPALRTAIMTHAEIGVVEQLLNAGADPFFEPDAIAPSTPSPMPAAAQMAGLSGNTKAVQTLLARLDTSALTPEQGNVLLFSAVQDASCLERVIAAGVKPRVDPDTKITPLHHAAWFGDATTVRLLVKHGADLHATDWVGYTPLHNAAEYGRIEVVATLLELGARHGLRTDNGFTTLHAGATSGEPKIVSALITAGADVLAKNKWGATPLFNATYQGSPRVAEVLLQHGADINAACSVPNTSSSPLGALIQGWAEEQKKSPPNTRDTARFLETASLLLAAGADVHQQAFRKQDQMLSPLLLSAELGLGQMIDILLKAGALIDAPCRSVFGRTALFSAVEFAQPSIVGLLLDRGANVQAKDNSGFSALHIAAGQNLTPMVRLLIEKGADIEAIDNAGGTPLCFAIDSGAKSAVRALLEHGANTNVKAHGFTTLQLAEKHLDIQALLISHMANREKR